MEITIRRVKCNMSPAPSFRPAAGDVGPTSCGSLLELFYIHVSVLFPLKSTHILPVETPGSCEVLTAFYVATTDAGTQAKCSCPESKLDEDENGCHRAAPTGPTYQNPLHPFWGYIRLFRLLLPFSQRPCRQSKPTKTMLPDCIKKPSTRIYFVLISFRIISLLLLII